MIVMLDEGLDGLLKGVREIVVSSRMRFFKVWCQRSILPWVWQGYRIWERAVMR